MTRQDEDNLWANAHNLPAYREALEQLNGFVHDPQMDEAENSDEGRVSRGAAVLGGIFGCIGSAAAVVAAVWWFSAQFLGAWISKLVDAVAFFLLLAVWLAAYAVLNPAEAATGDVSASAFSLFAAVGLAAVTSALVIAYAIVTKPRVRR